VQGAASLSLEHHDVRTKVPQCVDARGAAAVLDMEHLRHVCQGAALLIGMHGAAVLTFPDDPLRREGARRNVRMRMRTHTVR